MSDNDHAELDWFVEDFKEQLASRGVEITVRRPTDGEPLSLWVWPETTEEADRIERAKARGGVEPLVEIVVTRAKRADRSRIFTDADRVTLRKRSMRDALGEVALAIQRARPAPTPEQVGKR